MSEAPPRFFPAHRFVSLRSFLICFDISVIPVVASSLYANKSLANVFYMTTILVRAIARQYLLLKSMNINKVTIAGRLTRDPDVRFTPSGQAVADITVATTRYYKDKSSTDMKEETAFVDVTAWEGPQR